MRLVWVLAAVLLVSFGVVFIEPVRAEPICEVYRITSNPVQFHRQLLLAVDGEISITPDPLERDLAPGSFLVTGWQVDSPGDTLVLHAGMLVFPTGELYALRERNKDLADIMAPLFIGSLFIALAGFIRKSSRGQPQPQYARDRMRNGTA